MKILIYCLSVTVVVSLCLEPTVFKSVSKQETLSARSFFSLTSSIQSTQLMQQTDSLWAYYASFPYVLAHELGHVIFGFLAGLYPIEFEVRHKTETKQALLHDAKTGMIYSAVLKYFTINPHVKFHKPLNAFQKIIIAPAGSLFELLLAAGSIYTLFFVGTRSPLFFFLAILGILSGSIHFYNRFKPIEENQENASDWELFWEGMRQIMTAEKPVRSATKQIPLFLRLHSETHPIKAAL